MFKDKDKQREANRQAKAKQRAKKAYNLAIELGMTPKGMTNRKNVIPCDIPDVIPKRGKDIKSFADLSDAAKHRVDNLVEAGLVRPTEVYGKPGDADYNGVCTEAWRAERGR